MWEKREAQWEKEAKAREQLMHEVSASGVKVQQLPSGFLKVSPICLCLPVQVLRERKKQLKLKMQKNREAQVESLREREELIQRLELQREAWRHQREQEEQLVASRMQEVSI